MTIDNLHKLFLQYPIICTDTRKITKDCLFFALKGERFNGNKFAAQALQNGAAYAIVDEVETSGESAQFIFVNDVLQTLQQLATYHRKQFNIPLIAITGSNGKTTTKELIAAVMNTQYKTPFTQGNLNNHIGVPLTLLSFEQTAEAAIVEMGANHQGEIDFLCELAQPTHGLITNIGKAHLEGFGGIEGVRKGKTELFRFLNRSGGVVFINEDEPSLTESTKLVDRKVTYKVAEEPSKEEPAKEIKCLALHPFIEVAFLSETGELVKSKTNLAGKHNFQNVMTAIAIGKYFKVPAKKIIKAIEEYQAVNNRSQWLKWKGFDVFLDAYNANPSSMKAALTSFMEQKKGGVPQLAILGEMRELGVYSAKAHNEIGNWAMQQHLGKIFLVGPQFEETAAKLKLPFFKNVDDLKSNIDWEQWKQAQVFIKGSRGVALEQLINSK